MMTWHAAAMVAALVAAPAAMAADMTVIKGGEWTTTVTGVGPQPMTATVCMAEQRLDRLAEANKAGTDCTKRDVAQIPNGVKMDLVCNGMAIQGTAVSTGPDSYRTEMTMTMQGAPPMKMISEAKYNGPCKPGQTPANR